MQSFLSTSSRPRARISLPSSSRSRTSGTRCPLTADRANLKPELSMGNRCLNRARELSLPPGFGRRGGRLTHEATAALIAFSSGATRSCLALMVGIPLSWHPAPDLGADARLDRACPSRTGRDQRTTRLAIQASRTTRAVHHVPTLLAGRRPQRHLAALLRLHRHPARDLPGGAPRPRAAGTRIYQSVFFIPVVLSLAVVGFIWQLQYTSQGFINSVLGTTRQDNAIDWLGNPNLNIWAVLVAASWRHVGYIMVLYLAGLKSVDPTLREAACDRRRERAPDLLPRRLPGDAPDQRRDHRRDTSSSRCGPSTSPTSSTTARTA